MHNERSETLFIELSKINHEMHFKITAKIIDIRRRPLHYDCGDTAELCLQRFAKKNLDIRQPQCTGVLAMPTSQALSWQQ